MPAHDAPLVAWTVIDLIKPEADALVAAGAAQYPLDETGPPIPEPPQVASCVAWLPYRRGPALKAHHRPQDHFSNGSGVGDYRRNPWDRQRQSKASSHCEVYYPRGKGG